ncbi:GH32 C-terminal domain-containing protein [Paenibacillus chungangensis]|uniref:GH32 C-terminal domain-containing protein n=1 Tax=Paenibacillus chungangensis TaxID=696535 RepID=A0ABW3HX29_9BACL
MVEKQLHFMKRYIHFPIGEDQPVILMTMRNDHMFRQFEIKLADGPADYWMSVDISSLHNEQLTISIDNGSVEQLNALEQGDHIKDSEMLYKESGRPQLHFSARRGWLNDPNGLVYADGLYHLFYQHNPYGRDWGNMHWGHAVSDDLLHWTEQEIALYPDEMGTMFSGSAVIDWHNTSGLQEGNEPPIILIYTAAGDSSPLSEGKPYTQCLAYRNAQGEWIKHEGNPVVPHIAGSNRDPKVIWHEPTRRWVMVLYMEGSDYAILVSPDLIQWRITCRLTMPGMDECPDLFQLPVDGDSTQAKWVFWACKKGGYQLGSFDGEVFIPEGELLFTVPDGANSYAAQTWSDIPASDGRVIQTTWAYKTSWPDMPFTGYMTFPCELSLVTAEEGIRMALAPVREIELIKRGQSSYGRRQLATGDDPIAHAAELMDVQLHWKPEPGSKLAIEANGAAIVYDAATEQLSCGPIIASLRVKPDGTVKLRTIIDRTSLETFGNEGILYMPVSIAPNPNHSGLRVYVNEGAGELLSMEVHELESIWNQQ